MGGQSPVYIVKELWIISRASLDALEGINVFAPSGSRTRIPRSFRPQPKYSTYLTQLQIIHKPGYHTLFSGDKDRRAQHFETSESLMHAYFI